MRRRVDWMLVVLLFVAALVRFPGLGARSLWFDEALSGLIARLDATEVLSNAAGSSHPPGYYFLLHLWRPLGRSEFALRFPSAWFSLLAVALVARLARDLFDPRTARLAALGMAIAPFQVYYAQEARMYGVAIALSAGLLWAFLRGARDGKFGGWWLYGVLVALGLYVHYYVALVVLALHLWLLLDWSRVRRAFPALPIADGLAAVAFVPQLTQFRAEAGEFLGSARWRVAPSPLEPVRTLHYLLFGHVMPLWLVPVALFLILGLLALGVFECLRRGSGELGKLLLMVVLIPIIVALIVSLLATPIYVERSFAVVTPALAMFLARSIVTTPRRSPVPYLGGALAILMALGVVLYHIRDDPAKPPIEEAVSVVARQAQTSGDVFHLQDASYLPALYYEPPGGTGALLDVGQRLWLASEAYSLLGGSLVHFNEADNSDYAVDANDLPDELASVDPMWLVVMPTYLDAAQRAFLDDWEAMRQPAQRWNWRMIQVRLYVPDGER